MYFGGEDLFPATAASQKFGSPGEEKGSAQLKQLLSAADKPDSGAVETNWTRSGPLQALADELSRAWRGAGDHARTEQGPLKHRTELGLDGVRSGKASWRR